MADATQQSSKAVSRCTALVLNRLRTQPISKQTDCHLSVMLLSHCALPKLTKQNQSNPLQFWSICLSHLSLCTSLSSKLSSRSSHNDSAFQQAGKHQSGYYCFIISFVFFSFFSEHNSLMITQMIYIKEKFPRQRFRYGPQSGDPDSSTKAKEDCKLTHTHKSPVVTAS